jgi:hypothetical protein
MLSAILPYKGGGVLWPRAEAGVVTLDSQAGGLPSLPSGPEDLVALNDDRLIGYALAVQPAFADLRALLGQLSGMLILLQARRGRELSDLPDLAGARERWREVIDRLARLDPPRARAADRRRLQDAAAHVEAALDVLAQMRRARAAEGVAETARHLKTAYRLMQSACDHRLGLGMVDLNEACCRCGHKPA